MKPYTQGQTNRGTIMGPVALTPEDQEWKETVGAKKTIYGQFRVAIGGKAPNGPEKRSDHDVEPVFFNAMPVMFFVALLKRLFVKSFYDTSPGTAAAACACALLRVGYWCLAMSHEHAEQIRPTTR